MLCKLLLIRFKTLSAWPLCTGVRKVNIRKIRIILLVYSLLRLERYTYCASASFHRSIQGSLFRRNSLYSFAYVDAAQSASPPNTVPSFNSLTDPPAGGTAGAGHRMPEGYTEKVFRFLDYEPYMQAERVDPTAYAYSTSEHDVYCVLFCFIQRGIQFDQHT